MRQWSLKDLRYREEFFRNRNFSEQTVAYIRQQRDLVPNRLMPADGETHLFQNTCADDRRHTRDRRKTQVAVQLSPTYQVFRILEMTNLNDWEREREGNEFESVSWRGCDRTRTGSYYYASEPTRVSHVVSSCSVYGASAYLSPDVTTLPPRSPRPSPSPGFLTTHVSGTRPVPILCPPYLVSSVHTTSFFSPGVPSVLYPNPRRSVRIVEVEVGVSSSHDPPRSDSPKL